MPYLTDSIVDNTSIYSASITQNICKLKHIIILFILTAYLASIDCMQIWDESTRGRVFISLHILKMFLREESTAPPQINARPPLFAGHPLSVA